MAELEFDSPVVPRTAEFELSGGSTPMRRAARQLQAALPDGWEVEVVDAPRRPGQIAAAMLRVQTPR
ncbi:hypothetical protein [Nocardia macrotermitis]|uniref:Uncharacterized protein n=1 Tax=Nocardia macrotermitis TaxID=2585198 RepID=A0A7K0DCK4_9NOCA|nr:hypothetical protein [Nocardia macrotermitis]MQY23515.1 hypothetical protein [Nocardia macrotermitis]